MLKKISSLILIICFQSSLIAMTIRQPQQLTRYINYEKLFCDDENEIVEITFSKEDKNLLDEGGAYGFLEILGSTVASSNSQTKTLIINFDVDINDDFALGKLCPVFMASHIGPTEEYSRLRELKFQGTLNIPSYALLAAIVNTRYPRNFPNALVKLSSTIPMPQMTGKNTCKKCDGRGYALCPQCKGEKKDCQCTKCNGFKIDHLTKCEECNGIGKEETDKKEDDPLSV